MSEQNRFLHSNLEENVKKYAEELMRLSRKGNSSVPKPTAPPAPPPPPPEPPEPPMPPAPPASDMPMPAPPEAQPGGPCLSNEEYFRAALEEMAPFWEKLEGASATAGSHTLADGGQHTHNHQATPQPDSGQQNPTDIPLLSPRQSANDQTDELLTPAQASVFPGTMEDLLPEEQTEYSEDAPVAEGPPVGEENLDSKTNPPANQNTGNLGDDGSEAPYTDSAYLKVQVSAGGRAVPIPLATVTVSRADNEEQVFHQVLQTDADGKTPTITLPAPDRRLSETPTAQNPYAVYQVTVSAPNFQSERLMNVQMFAGQISILPVQLIPLPNKNPDQVSDVSKEQPASSSQE